MISPVGSNENLKTNNSPPIVRFKKLHEVDILEVLMDAGIDMSQEEQNL